MKTIFKTSLIAFIMVLVGSAVSNVTAQYANNDPQYYDDDPQYYGNDRDVSYQTFYDELSPYGEWVDFPGHGYVWVPDADEDFQPYSTKGHWVWTDNYEWMWVSDYDWGWAPFHYGRWDNDPYYGWYWVPGYEWSPAWVAWRDGGDYYGWAPIRPGINININFNIGGYSPPNNFWCFAPRRYISSPYINRYYVNPRQNVTIINQTNIIINNYRYGGNYGFRSGPRRVEVERYTGRINPVRFRQTNTPGRSSFRGNVVSVYRPNVRQDNNRNFAPRRVQQFERREGSFRNNRNVTNNNGRINDNMNNRRNNTDRRDFGNRNNNVNNQRNNPMDRRDIGNRNNNSNNRVINQSDRRNIDPNNNRQDQRNNDRIRRQPDGPGDGDIPNNNRRFDRPAERSNNGNSQSREQQNRRIINERPQRQPQQMERRTNEQPRQQQSQPSRQFERRDNANRQAPQRIDRSESVRTERRQPQQMERRQPSQQSRQVERNDNRSRSSTSGNRNSERPSSKRKF